jgi:hypothetical protein
MSSAEFL